MLYKEYISLKSLFAHKVGNKLNQDEIIFSKTPIQINENLQKLLISYFFSSFKSEELYRFNHDIELSFNEVYTCVSKVFANPDLLNEESKNLARHLYNQSVHPKVKNGEFYVAYFKDCIFDGKTVDAVGLFKSENKDIFIEVEQVADGFEMESRQGINLNKLDKGCLIFNTEREKGYVLSIVDSTNKGNDAQYWKDDFLSIRVLNNEYHQTNQFLGIAKNFVTKQISDEYDVSKPDKIDLLNRSVDYFKTHENFDKLEFENVVFQDSGIINSFRSFENNYCQENEIEITDNFEISPQAVKKQARVFKSVLKLDKNFHIYIHGDKELIEQGVEKDGRKFYKIYYQDES